MVGWVNGEMKGLWFRYVNNSQIISWGWKHWFTNCVFPLIHRSHITLTLMLKGVLMPFFTKVKKDVPLAFSLSKRIQIQLSLWISFIIENGTVLINNVCVHEEIAYVHWIEVWGEGWWIWKMFLFMLSNFLYITTVCTKSKQLSFLTL